MITRSLPFRDSIFAAILGLGLTVAALAGDWTQFRGPGGAASADNVNLPSAWSATENLRWKVDLPGRGLSNPVIAGGRVYVTACSGYLETRLHVLCYDVAVGKKLWERQFAATGNTMCHPKTCMAAPTPVTDGERVYALFATGDLACLDRDGSLVWYRSLARDYPTITNHVGMAASPVLWKDVLLLPMENAGESFAAGLDKLSGKNRWKIERFQDINWVTPLVIANGDRAEVLFQTAKEVTAYDPRTGELRWTHPAGNSVATPIRGDGLIFITANEFTALRPRTDGGTPDVVWKSTRLRTGYSSPLYYQGRVYAINTAGILNCADATDGKPLWQLRLKGPFSASPVAANGRIYAVNEEGATSVVELGAEPKILSTNDVGETILATPAIADGAIFLRSDQHLYCIGGR